MQLNKLNLLKLFLFLGIGALLIWLPLSNLSETQKSSIGKAFDQADYFWVFVSLTLSVLSHVSRAMRWKILLEPLGYNPKLSNTFFAVMLGYLANYALRLGEALRCMILTRYEKIPFSVGFGTVIAERIIDLISLAIIFVITLVVQFDQLFSYVNDNILIYLKPKLIQLTEHPVYIVLGLLLLVALLFFTRRKKASDKKKEGIIGKLIGLAQGFVGGLKSVKDIRRPYLFIIHSIIIWLLYTSSIYVGFMCFKETSPLGIDASFAVLIFSTIGVIIVPGGTGASQLLIVEVMTSIFKISHPIAFAFAWISWGSQFFLFLGFGILSLILLIILNRKNETQ